MYIDSKTGEILDPFKLRAARKEEIGELERRVYVMADLDECWTKIGKPPIAVRWVDVHKGEGVYRSRLVAKDFKPKSKVGDIDGLFAATPPRWSWSSCSSHMQLRWLRLDRLEKSC